MKASCWLFLCASLSIPANASDNIVQQNNVERSKNERAHADSKLGKSPPKHNTVIEQQEDWLDGFHQAVSGSVYDSALWFDGFFAPDNSRDMTPKTSARIRLGWEPRARNLDENDVKFRLRVRLPNFERKADLIFTDTPDDTAADLPLQNSRNRKVTTHSESFSAAVRVVHNDDAKRFVDSRIGISGGDLFARARVRKKFDLPKMHNFYIEPSIFYFLDEGAGARIIFDYRYDYAVAKEFRFEHSTWVSEDFSGVRWKNGIYHLNQIDDNSASLYGLIIDGERNGENSFQVNNYYLHYRYRFNAFKKWMFIEVEPFLEFPEEFDYKITPGIALRIEGYFERRKR